MDAFPLWIIGRDKALRSRWERALRREAWAVQAGESVAELRGWAAAARTGMALVEAGVLGASPAAAVDRLRGEVPGVSVILFGDEASLGAEAVIRCFESGADDFFPAAIAEKLLVAKLKAHLRRILPSMASALDVVQSPGGSVKLDRSQHSAWIRGPGGEWAATEPLTPTEFGLLALLLERPGAVLDRAFILESVWKQEAEAVLPATVDKHMGSLRAKLGPHGRKIQSVYGRGYAFRESAK